MQSGPVLGGNRGGVGEAAEEEIGWASVVAAGHEGRPAAGSSHKERGSSGGPAGGQGGQQATTVRNTVSASPSTRCATGNPPGITSDERR